jgi:hypothetical protein
MSMSISRLNSWTKLIDKRNRQRVREREKAAARKNRR